MCQFWTYECLICHIGKCVLWAHYFIKITSLMRKLICLLAYEGMELLDFAGPQSAFYEALQGMDDSYELKIEGFDRSIVQCEAGLQYITSTFMDNVGACHTLIVPGGREREVCQSHHLSYLATC